MHEENRVIIKFGDVAKQLKGSVDRDNNPFERYIEGGHMDSASLHLKRWGVFDDDYVGPAFHRIFNRGNILYGSRRTYLKKVSVAEFDGITANTTFVIEARSNENFDGRLLPYLMLSDGFTRYSVSKSKGSTNPYINWKDLIDFEFSLPTKKMQERKYQLLQRTEYLIREIELIEGRLIKLKRQVEKEVLLGGNDFQSLFGGRGPCIPNGWELKKLGDILTRVQYGSSEALHADGSIPILRMMNLEDGKVTVDDLKYSKASSEELSEIVLEKGDILFNRTNSMDLVGKTALFEVEGVYAFASYLLRLNVDLKVVTPGFVNRYLNHPLIQYRLKAYATPGVSQANINPGSLKQIPIVLPPLEFIRKVDELLAKYEFALKELLIKKQKIKKIQEFFRESLLQG
ncbi:restriction endonuclease subunit S [Pseudomonas sp. P2757]|uniref:restriction endonuclease subunit S n=1 Tax=unclassified Pseudomonas TaxID=196821 RepID=UPI003B58C46F